jgi:hypothetical protein
MQFQHRIGREGRLAVGNIAGVSLQSQVMALLVTSQSDGCEPSWLVWTHWTSMNSFCLVVVHHVFLEKCWRSKDLVADSAGSFTDAVDVSHVVEERAFGGPEFGTDVALVDDVFWNADAVWKGIN